MAKTIINDTNLEITNFKVNKQNELEELQINGNEVSLGEETALEDNKASTITENGTFEIEPSTGYDGMKKVTVDVDVAERARYLYRWRLGTQTNYRYTSVAPQDITVGSTVYISIASNSEGMQGIATQSAVPVTSITESDGVYTMTLQGFTDNFVFTPGDTGLLPSILTI